MKLCALQWIIALTFVGASIAHNVGAQVLDQEISLTLTGVPFEEALHQIQDLTNVKFFYSPAQLMGEAPVTIQIDGWTLGEVLEGLLRPRGIEYRVHEKEAIITLRKVVNGSESVQDEGTMARKRQVLIDVTGRVMDANGQPLAGVNVVVKGTSVGTTTDSEGRYSIDASGDAVLVFSFIGFSTYETRVGGRTVIDVVLEENITNLGEVVVNAGYYSTTRKLQTGSIVKISSEDISKQPVSDPLAALQGRVAGMEIVQNSGVPGSNFSVRIRGTNSISSGNDPLYIIDGVPYTSSSLFLGETSGGLLPGGMSPLNSINPSDIESIEVLKDADATAIYGSRGANGVVLITTKKGTVGKPKVELNLYTGVGQVPKFMDLLNTEQYLEMRREAYANDNITPSPASAPDLLSWDTTRYTDWQKVLIGNSAKVTDLEASISGGDSNTKFRIGIGYRKETTVFPGDNSTQRASCQLGIESVSDNQKFKTSFTANYSHILSDMLSVDLTSRSLFLAPNAPALNDANGKLNWEGWTPTYPNPVAELEKSFEGTTNNLIGNIGVSYSILSNLKARLSAGYVNSIHEAITVIPKHAQSPESFPINRSIFANSKFTNWILEPQLSWRAEVFDGSLEMLLGTTFLDQSTSGIAQYANGFSSEALMKNIAAASDVIPSTNYYSQYRYHAIFGRVNYTYKSRYVLNITGRRDGSSRFGPGRQFALFKAVGLGWVFSEEPFAEELSSVLSFGKLRVSYGTAGNDQIGDYQFLDTYELTGEYRRVIGLGPSRLHNPDFAWEETRKLEFALELGLLNDRIQLAVSHYRNRSTNQLVGQPLAPTTGFSQIQANFPATVDNDGWEIELHAQNSSSKTIDWSASLLLTLPKNRLSEFPDIQNFPAYSEQYVVGEPLSIAKRYRYLGIDPNTGFYIVEDLNDDGAFNFEDRQVVKFRGRRFYGSVQNRIRFRGLELAFLVQLVKQEGFNATRMFTSVPGSLSNQPTWVMNRVQVIGEDASMQRFTTGGEGAANYMDLYHLSDALMGDNSFLRIKHVTLSYTLPWNFGVTPRDAQIFVRGQNLLTFSNYGGLDPENAGSNSLPPLRVIAGGIHLTF